MAINVFTDTPIAVVAIQTATFETIGLTDSNIYIIHRIGNPPKSWQPTRVLNAITGFVEGDTYNIYAKTDLDLTAYVVPPIPDDTFDIQNWTIANFSQVNHKHPISDILATGTRNETTFLRGDGTWAIMSGSGDEQDPTVAVYIKAITEANIANWNASYAWGNHATQSYITTETDPTVPAHVKTITSTNISNWNTAYGWGNHATAGYITEYNAETDPVFIAHAAYGVTGTKISNWDAAHNKRITGIAFSGTSTKTLTLTQGDGTTLTATFSASSTETDPTVASHIKSITSANITTWNTAVNKRVTGIAFSGTGTKTLTLTHLDGSALTASFTDSSSDAGNTFTGTADTIPRFDADSNLIDSIIKQVNTTTIKIGDAVLGTILPATGTTEGTGLFFGKGAITSNLDMNIGYESGDDTQLTGEAHGGNINIGEHAGRYFNQNIVAKSSYNINIGNFTATNQTDRSVNIGFAVGSGGEDNVLIGHTAGTSDAKLYHTTVVGSHAGLKLGSDSIALGSHAGTNTAETISFNGYSNTFLGTHTKYHAASGTQANITNSTALGANVILQQSNSVILGNLCDVGIGTNQPTERLHVDGNARITALAGTGTRMVVADENGVLSTEEIGGGSTPSLDAVLEVGGGSSRSMSVGNFVSSGTVYATSYLMTDSYAYVGDYLVVEEGASIGALQGTGTRMVVADENGNLLTQSLPSNVIEVADEAAAIAAVNAGKWGCFHLLDIDELRVIAKKANGTAGSVALSTANIT